jgi:hypothetical protein
MNVSSNDCDWVLFVKLLDIQSFFMTNLLNFSMYFFLLSQGVHKIDSRITIRSKYWSRFINMKNLFLQVYDGTLMWCLSMKGCFIQVMLLTYKIINHNMI